ncbi:uncharacterized protein LOC126845184 [Adelges cooleyi]|uniref:uncharacterized protein LOC126845184 n=1 Tax=Adelges cooleyi TaxID=133065 RepID=UPI002180039C|nr:uncharacterized protein LOC126845184 [Adelges cooleyi]
MFLKFSLSFLFFILAVSCMHTGQPEGKNEPEASGSAVPEEKINVTPEDLALENLQINGESDDELIKEAFESIRIEVKKEFNDNFTSGNIGHYDYYFYMGENYIEWDFIYSYLENHKQGRSEYYWIDFLTFRDLFKIHCEKSGVPVAKIAEQRKVAIVKHERNPAFKKEFATFLRTKAYS